MERIVGCGDLHVRGHGRVSKMSNMSANRNGRTGSRGRRIKRR